MAHTGEGLTGGFLSGFVHPIRGWDHVAAMVAVGLWGTFLGRPAIWMLPVVFPLVMALGGAIGVMGLPLPGVETGIALSSVVLGALILGKAQLPLWSAVILVGIFAIFHGYAHGIELPTAANPVSFAIGFVFATGLLHLAGIGLGRVTALPRGAILVQAAGALIAATGTGFLLGVF
ncbi:nickel transporter [Hyphomonas oceanitis SCH89]|uniref:Nickel transporter n=2 Tax=Hyphomonas oceanitis TaxID=81033 RepID=A0A059G5Q6_9PROT|nr:nickel transporter [Hyphomonas oceanitis SCH89]